MDLDQSKSRALGDGQWGVPVSFADATLLRMLQPGDDIAIVGTFNYSEPVKMGKNADAEIKMVEKTVTAVIYPRVSILEINGGSVLLSYRASLSPSCFTPPSFSISLRRSTIFFWQSEDE